MVLHDDGVSLTDNAHKLLGFDRVDVRVVIVLQHHHIVIAARCTALKGQQNLTNGTERQTVVGVVVGDGIHIRACGVEQAFDFEGLVHNAVAGDHIALKIAFSETLDGDVFKTVTPLVAPKRVGARESCRQVSEQTHTDAVARQDAVAIDQIALELVQGLRTVIGLGNGLGLLGGVGVHRKSM